MIVINVQVEILFHSGRARISQIWPIEKREENCFLSVSGVENGGRAGFEEVGFILLGFRSEVVATRKIATSGVTQRSIFRTTSPSIAGSIRAWWLADASSTPVFVNTSRFAMHGLTI